MWSLEFRVMEKIANNLINVNVILIFLCRPSQAAGAQHDENYMTPSMIATPKLCSLVTQSIGYASSVLLATQKTE